jgi:hypothetical protein
MQSFNILTLLSNNNKDDDNDKKYQILKVFTLLEQKQTEANLHKEWNHSIVEHDITPLSGHKSRNTITTTPPLIVFSSSECVNFVFLSSFVPAVMRESLPAVVVFRTGNVEIYFFCLSDPGF